MLLLLLSPGETLLCIFHCQVWLPIMFHSYFAAPHSHHHHGHMALAPADQRSPAPAVAGFGLPLEGPAAPICWMTQGPARSSDAPFHLPPSPIHEMILALLPALLVPLVCVARALAPPGRLFSVFLPPPLRPPIRLAA